MSDPLDYSWTGHHVWSKQAQRAIPSYVFKSLPGGIDILDSAILLTSNYVTVVDIRKRTDVGAEPPVSASWGGNFGVYIQHQTFGRAAPHGTLTGALRAQLEVTQDKGSTPINDASAIYAGIYNNGIDVGGFGLHVDAYHVGNEIHGHSTYAYSAECWKQSLSGRMVCYVARAQQGEVDYGLTLLHSGNGTFKRGIQFGNPTYGMGGVQGAPGLLTHFNVGIDMTHGQFDRHAAVMVKMDDRVILSGVPQAQDWPVVDICNLRFEGATGMFAVRNGDEWRFDVNMSNGSFWQNGQRTWMAWDWTTPYVFTAGPGKTTHQAPSATPVKWMRVMVEGEEFLMPLFRP